MKKLITAIFKNQLIGIYESKKIIALFISICIHLLLQADGVEVKSVNDRTIEIKVSAKSDLQFIEKELSDRNTYSRFFVSGTAILDEGKPCVPGFARWILIPNGTTVNISTSHGKPVVYENIDLAPLQPEPYDNKDAPLPPFTKDEKIYSTNTEYPGVLAETDNIKHKRGQALTMLWVYPYQYNPVQRKLTVYPEINVTVSFTGNIEPIPSNLKSGNLIQSLKSMAINAEAVLAAEENFEKSSNGKDGIKANGCEMLIITHPDYEAAANTLASWKIRKGIFSWVVTTNTTGGTMNQIEDYIDNAYDNWSPAPDYLLFIGDAEDIPVGYYESGGDILGTDFFYADYDDPADYVADFGYGRLSVDNAEDADSVVARIIRYERSPTDNPNFYQQTINAGCFQDGENGDNGVPDELPDNIANRRFCKTMEDIRGFLMSKGYSVQREYLAYNRVNTDEIFPMNWNDNNQMYTFIFENDNPPNGGVALPAELLKPTFPWDGSTADVTSAFNAGKYFALYRAHGSRGGWGDPSFHEAQVDALNNGENRPFIWSITCQSGWFDNETDDINIYNTNVNDECFAEHWLRHNTGGSCGILAACRNSTSGPNDRFIWGLMDAIWPDFTTWCLDPYGGPDPIYKMGDVINYGKAYMATKYSSANRVTTLYHWFGDPTSEMWTSQPSELTSAEVTSSINIGTSSITVQVYPATEDMLVAICSENNDSIFGTAYTNTSGIASVGLNHPIAITDPLYITVTKHNYKPYEFQAGWDVPGIWEGTVSTDWHNANNWTFNHIPDNTSNISIPVNCPHFPVVSGAVAECKNLTIASNAILTISNAQLTINGDMIIHGEFSMISGAADLVIYGDVSWESGSTAAITSSTALMDIFAHWIFKAGSNVHLDNGYVRFSGINKGIKCYSADSYFNHIIINNDVTKYTYYSSSSTEDLLIKGDLDINPDATFRHYSDKKMIVDGTFVCDGAHRFSFGTFVFNGVGMDFYSNTNSFFNNLEINSTGNIDLMTDIEIRGGLSINAGNLSPHSNTITIDGDWDNEVGSAGFTEATGTVVFSGDSDQQIINDEYFNILELDNSAGSLIIDNLDVDVICNQYNWTNGVFTMHAGEFTAYDLYDDGIFGNYFMDGGTINLMNFDGYVDMNCDLTMESGYFNIYGGTDDSYWPFAANAFLTMSGGVLDFKDVGIHCYDSPSWYFNENITGGVIRTTGDFTGDNDDFNPPGGTLELYGPDDANLGQGPFCTFRDVRIEKAPLKDSWPFNIAKPA
ncbi:MAG: hypothetical protein K8R86_07825, partial [Bacteroidales bacterium]|nr:hypothetical protein [Bacteroidales bacterium]